jgi:hypothetical protein
MNSPETISLASCMNSPETIYLANRIKLLIWIIVIFFLQNNWNASFRCEDILRLKWWKGDDGLHMNVRHRTIKYVL